VTTPVGIRRADKNDFPNLAQLWHEGHASGRDFQSLLVAQGVFTYLAEDETVFGAITVGPELVDDTSGIGELMFWFVIPDYRRAGWGQKLLVHGMSVLKRRFYEHACVWIPGDNLEALSIVTRLGFEPDGREKVDNRAAGDRESVSYARSLDDFF
jgi:ribosomal protein S18 acetylase RimI-like enzyme